MAAYSPPPGSARERLEAMHLATSPRRRPDHPSRAALAGDDGHVPAELGVFRAPRRVLRAVCGTGGVPRAGEAEARAPIFEPLPRASPRVVVAERAPAAEPLPPLPRAALEGW